MRSRVQYDSKLGFKFTSSTNVPKALQILSDALDDQVITATSCFICEKALGSEEKKDAVVCSECLSSKDAYALYTMRFVQLMDA
jgi:hypothetical protein